MLDQSSTGEQTADSAYFCWGGVLEMFWGGGEEAEAEFDYFVIFSKFKALTLNWIFLKKIVQLLLLTQKELSSFYPVLRYDVSGG